MGAAGAALLGACGTPTATSSSATPTTTPGKPAPSAASAAGCGVPASGKSSGSSTLTLTIGGHRRIVVVHLPEGYTGSKGLPLVLNLQGSASSAAGQEHFSGMDATANAHDFIVAYPQALIPDGTGYAWNVPGASLADGIAVPKGSANDVTFLTSLVSVLEQRYCVDPAMVYATGFSGGGRMVSALACDASNIFAAIAPVSGIRRPLPCQTKRAVPVIAFHGTDDRVDPYDGNGQSYWTYSVPQAAAYWASQDKCSPTATTATGAGFELTTYGGCAARASVELYTIVGEGHEWPGGPRLSKVRVDALGPQSDAVDADSTMWAFFAAHPMP